MSFIKNYLENYDKNTFAMIRPFPAMASETWTSIHPGYPATVPKKTGINTPITTIAMIMTMRTKTKRCMTDGGCWVTVAS